MKTHIVVAWCLIFFKMRRPVSAVVAALLLSPISAPAQERPEAFIFQDNFWLNLHQFLLGEVYRKNVKAQPGLDSATLTESERQIWNRALDSYTGLAKRDLLFDDMMRTISNTLAMSADPAQLPDNRALSDPIVILAGV